MTVRPAAMAYLRAHLPTLDTTPGLVRCATAVALHDLPGADPPDVERQIEAIAGTIDERLRSDNPRAILAHAHAVLFEEMGFRGDVDDYDNPINSYLPRVLGRRRGLPIALALVYKAVLHPLGVEVVGVNAPMHFLVSVDDAEEGRMYVDPFVGGRVLTADEVFERIERSGTLIERDPAHLAPADHRVWLLRLLRNLVLAFDRRGDRDRMAAMAEMYAVVEAAEGAE